MSSMKDIAIPIVSKQYNDICFNHAFMHKNLYNKRVL